VNILKIVAEYTKKSIEDCKEAGSLVFCNNEVQKTSALAYANKSLSNLSVAVSIAYAKNDTISKKYEDIFDQIDICNRTIIDFYAEPTDENSSAVKTNLDILANMEY